MIDLAEPLRFLAAARVLVTGASGSIGKAAARALYVGNVAAFQTDLREGFGVAKLDVRDDLAVVQAFARYRPTHVLHLAGAKHAPEGELDPAETCRTNVEGTANVLHRAGAARVVLASTCKACDPETAYGASKLIAERMTLNAGGSVARFYNVPESSGNVFRLWEELPSYEPIPVAPCARYFVPIEDAVGLLLWAAVLEPGRYAPVVGMPRRMDAVARDLYPDRPQVPIAPRRGDRVNEPLYARGETAEPAAVRGLVRVSSPHDCQAAAGPSLLDLVPA